MAGCKVEMMHVVTTWHERRPLIVWVYVSGAWISLARFLVMPPIRAGVEQG